MSRAFTTFQIFKERICSNAADGTQKSDQQSHRKPIRLLDTQDRQLGGAERDRTADPLLAKQVLSQLSYSPMMLLIMVGLGRFELPTSPLSGVRSNQLSYRPVCQNTKRCQV